MGGGALLIGKPFVGELQVGDVVYKTSLIWVGLRGAANVGE
jgi:hypothetical protein